jgi:uncharacterized protein
MDRSVNTNRRGAESFLLNVTADPLMANGPAHHKRRANTALRMLKRYPEIAKTNIHTAVVCGELDEVKRILDERPEAATEPGGPLRKRQLPARDKLWSPLLHLCYGRLPTPAVAENSLAIAELLLDHGADPNDFFEVGSHPCRYTALCGVAGEGEDDAPPHPQRNELAKLLLDRGAQPYDVQLFYNIHFHGQILWLMELIYATSVARGQKSDWEDPLWTMLDIGLYGSGARYLLNIAVTNNNLELAEWLLSHGATPNAPPAKAPNLSKLSLYQEAISRGFVEMANVLTQNGAVAEQQSLSPIQEFAAACLTLDREKIESMVQEHPEFLQSHLPIFAAAQLDRADVVELLLDLGTPIEIEDQTKQRTLHVAAGHSSLKVAQLLVSRGAQLDALETNWQSTPLDQAFYGDRTAMIELLSGVSSDIFRVVWAGNKRRLLELLHANPELAKINDDGTTPLMWLPDDERLSVELAQLLLDHGADQNAKNSEGMTAADIAERRALYDAADLLCPL